MGFNLDYARHLVLPVATLCVQIVASWSRFQRASMLDVLGADYVRTARAKGVPRRKVIFKHALRNALIPFVTVMALDFGALFGGLIITEKIFSIGGMGRLFYNALLVGDVYVLEAWMIVVAVLHHRLQPARRRAVRRARSADPALMTIERTANGRRTGSASRIARASRGSRVEPTSMRRRDRREPTPARQWQLFRRRFLRHRLAVGRRSSS